MTKTFNISRRSFLVAGVAGLGAVSTADSHALRTLSGPGGVWDEARALVDSGAIGRPYYVGLRLPRGAASVDDVAGHMARVSYALRLGAPSKVSGAGRRVARDGFPADYMVSAKYARGVMFSITTGPAVRVGEPYVIRGDAGTIKVYESDRPYLELEEESRRGRMRVRASTVENVGRGLPTEFRGDRHF